MVAFSIADSYSTPDNQANAAPRFSLPQPPAPTNSQTQVNRNALTTALATNNLNGSDVADTYGTNKEVITNGGEQGIRDNISAIEQQNTVDNAKTGFTSAAVSGDKPNMQGFAQAAQDAAKILNQDAPEFNALDTFRQDTPATDADLQDKIQAILASSAMSNNVNDKQATGGMLDSINQVYQNLQKSADDNGNTLTTDILKGFANTPQALMQGIGKNLSTLFPDAVKSYTDYLASTGSDPMTGEQLRNNIATNLDNSKYKVGTAGNVAETMGAFGAAIVPVMMALPEVAAGGVTGATLNATRSIGAATIADATVFQGMDSGVKVITDHFPSTKNAITNWMGDRKENSPWENKAKQAIESTALNAVGDGLFHLLGSIRKIKLFKAKNAPMEAATANPITAATLMGDRGTASALTHQVVSNSSDLSPIAAESITTANAVESAVPSVLKSPLDAKPKVGLMGGFDAQEVRKQTLEAAQKLSQTINKVNRLTTEELAPAIENLSDSIRGNYAKNKVLDVSVNKDANGTNIASITLGQNGTGDGWATEELARNQTKGLNVEIQQTNDGKFYAVHQKAIPESGLTNAIDFSNSSWLMKNPVTRHVLDMSTQLPQTLMEDVGVAINSRQRLRRQFINPLMKDYVKGVTKEEFGHVNDIAAIGRDTVIDDSGRTGKWFDRDEFNNHYNNLAQTENAPESAWKSYQAYRDINDWHYAVENATEVARKDKMGMVELTHDTPDLSYRGNVIVKDTLQPNESFRVYIPSEQRVMAKGEIKANGLEQKYNDYKMVQVENTHQLESGEHIKYMLLKKDDFTTNMVDRIQVPYRAGGRVEYAGKYKYFSKQAVTSKLEDGTVVNHNPLTHYVSKSRQELVLHTAKLEDARNAYRSAMEAGEDGGKITFHEVKGIRDDGTFHYSKTGKQLTEEEANSYISKTGLTDLDTMKAHVEAGNINLEHPFEVRNDKELPLSYNKSNTSYMDDNHSGSATWLMTNKKTKFRSRGERLLSPTEKAAEVLSPHEAIDKSITSIVNYGVAGDYTSRISEQFAATARAFGFLKPEFRDAPAARIFMEGKNAIEPGITGVADGNYQGLLTTLNSMQRALGYKTTLASWKDAQVKKAIEYFESQAGSMLAPSMKRQKITNAMINFSHVDPLQAANTFQYYTNFAIKAAQFAMQAGSGYIEAAKLHPIKATQALMGVATHANYFFREDISHAQKFNQPLMKLLGYDNGDQFISYLENLKKSGYVDVLHTHVDLAKRKMVTGKHGTAFDLIDNILSKSTLAMESGEMINQMILHRTAYMKFQEQFPKLDIDSSSATGWIIREADRIGVDMKSAIQRDVAKNSLTAPLLRYKNFFMKSLEHNTIGGSRTPAEKAKYWAATAALTGLGFNETTHYWEQKFGLDAKDKQLMENGMLNWMTTNQQGDAPVDISNVVDVGGGIKNLYQTIMNGDAFNYLKTPLGQKLAQVKDKSVNSMLFMAQVWGAPASSDTKILSNALNESGKIMSFISPATRGAVALRTGKLYSEKGALITEGLSNTAAIATMLGFKSTQEIKYGNQAGLLSDRKKEATELANSVYYALQKADQVDRSTPAGEAEFKSWTDLANTYANTPDKNEVMRQVGQKRRYSQEGLKSTATKIKQEDTSRINFTNQEDQR